EYFRPPWQEPDVPTELPVLFEDEDLLVVNKPAGLPVLPGGGFLEKTVVHLLRTHKAHWQTVSPLHCLDRGTSGLLLLGKSREARSVLGRDFMHHRIGRVYLAVLNGLVEREHFSVGVPIGQEEHPRLGLVEAASARGKTSRTDFEVLARDPVRQSTLVKATPHTGRTHQIRIHAAWAGYPLDGEPFYVRGGKWDPERAAGEGDMPLPGACGFRLHSWQVRLNHPRTRESMRLVCPPPEGFWAGKSAI
ncbi:MAG: RluA family pseudouridine synthase, partial [Candidatus Sumerlaeia bacterium]|nr:RluA family pseudouridine synthase [Candidatus Sumerlaeia bacterium]